MYGQTAIQSKAAERHCYASFGQRFVRQRHASLVCRSENLTTPKYQALWPVAWQVSACNSLAKCYCTLLTEPVHAAGALTAVFVCPLDVLKTRLQVQGRAHAAAYKGIGGEQMFWPDASLQTPHHCALRLLYRPLRPAFDPSLLCQGQ